MIMSDISDGAVIPFNPGVIVYRGISDPVELQRLVQVGATPQAPLGGTAEEAGVFASQLAIGHVVHELREALSPHVAHKRFESFTFLRERAIAYATRCGTQDGWVLKFQLPRQIQSTQVGKWEFAHAGDDGTQWLDPRWLFTSAEMPVPWQIMRTRSRYDQEVLLVWGLVRPVDAPQRVRRQDYHPSFAPWTTVNPGGL